MNEWMIMMMMMKICHQCCCSINNKNATIIYPWWFKIHISEWWKCHTIWTEIAIQSCRFFRFCSNENNNNNYYYYRFSFEIYWDCDTPKVYTSDRCQNGWMKWNDSQMNSNHNGKQKKTFKQTWHGPENWIHWIGQAKTTNGKQHMSYFPETKQQQKKTAHFPAN